MVTISELENELNDHLECGQFKDYCHNGLQVEGCQEVSAVATAVTASLATIQEAVNLGVQLLVVHHGLFWSRDPYQVIGPKREKLRLLLENELSLLAYHLPLDAHRELGNNWRAAKEMGWENLQPFGELEGNTIGVMGTVPPQEREAFQGSLERYYDHPAHCAKGGKETVTTAALISGGAYRSIAEAAAVGVDCFVTGNYDEPAWHEAFERGVNFYALGHSATERIGPKALGKYLEETFGLKNHFIDQYNPF